MSNQISKEVTEEVQRIAKEIGVLQVNNLSELSAIVSEVLASKKTRAFLLGQVMQKTNGNANSKVVGEILTRRFGPEMN